jgi:signal transduction histidine kinase
VGSVGGRFAIESAPHRGTTVGFRLPLNGNAKEAYL